MTQQFIAPGVPLFKSLGVPAMDPNCCCGEPCYCPGAWMPGERAACKYATADFIQYSAWSTLAGWQVDIAGTCTHRPVRNAWDSDYVCTPSSCPCPSGSFVLGCNQNLTRSIMELVCEDYYYWFATKVVLFIQTLYTPPCNSDQAVVQVKVSSQTFYYPKTGSLPAEVGAGWQTVGGSGEMLVGGQLIKTWKFNDPGYTVYTSDITGDCTLDCIATDCLIGFPDPLQVKSLSSYTGGRRDGGCDHSGLIISAQALA